MPLVVLALGCYSWALRTGAAPRSTRPAVAHTARQGFVRATLFVEVPQESTSYPEWPEEAIKGKQCPICRGDYMREAASGWDALPAGTKELQLDEQPSQDELKRIAARFPRLKRLTICPEYSDEPEELDFAADGVRFPALISLELTCVGLKSLTFTEHNTPLLEELTLSNVQGECCPFHLALPQLRVLDAEHTMLGERPIDEGQFGLSLSRCPRLETVRSYKFRCLGDCNYAVLPSLTSLLLHRSECTTHLDILYAPKLREVSLQAAFDMRHFKLRNLPHESLSTVGRRPG